MKMTMDWMKWIEQKIAIITAEQRPAAHLCSRWCPFICRMGVHARLKGDGKCRCCLKIDLGSDHELARANDHSDLTTRWWETQPDADTNQAVA